MIKQCWLAAPDFQSIDECAMLLAGELELAIKWQRPCILFAVYGSEPIREELQSRLRNCLVDLGQRTSMYPFESFDPAVVPGLQESSKDNDRTIIFINGLGGSLDKVKVLQSRLDLLRGFLTDRQIRMVIWLNELEIHELAHKAPGFWVFRQRSIEMMESPRKNEVAMNTYQKTIERNANFSAPNLQQARLLARRDRYPEAVKAYEKVLSLKGNNSDIWNELGVLHNQNSASQQAEAAFLHALEQDRANAWAYSNLGVALNCQGRSKESVSMFLRSIDLFTENQDKAVSWNRVGDAYRKLNDYDNAIAAYQTADMLEIGSGGLSPESTEPAAQVSTVQQTEPQLRTAAQVFADTPDWLFDPNALLTEEMEQVNAHGSARGMTRQIAGKDSQPEPVATSGLKEEGIAEIHEQLTETGLLDGESTNATVWNEKGNVHFKHGAIEEAINAYNRAIQFDTEFGWPYSNLALAYLTVGQYAEAILLYQRSLDLLESDQDKAISWNGLGNVYRRMADYANAVKAYQKAAELDPVTAGMREGVENLQVGGQLADGRVWNELGEIFFKTGAYDESIQAFEKAISQDPENGWPLCNLARAYAAQGKYALAIPLFQKSIELHANDKDKAVAWNRLGNVYRKLNDYEHAIQAYQKAVALNDEDAELITRTRFSLLSNLQVN